MNNKMIFAKEDTEKISAQTYDILIVDDDESIHTMTIVALKHKIFDGKKLNILSAMSAKEAREILDKDNDIALALVDVIMETSEAGLELVNYIRNDLKNTNIRLVLRTGQPSQVPEEEIIDHYDINDYKEKTELTSEKLYTIVRTSIKQYELIKNLELTIDDITNELHEKNKIIVEQSRLTAMSDIITMIAHQWRQPLASISMNNNNLLLSIDLDNVDMDKFKETLESTNKQARELSDTIDNFRDFFKSNTKSEDIDINKLLDKSFKVIGTTLNENSIQILKNYDHGINIFTNKHDFIQIIINIVKNSIDAYNENNIDHRTINIYTTNNEDNIEIRIKDNAGGIPADIIDNIFDPYFSTKDAKNGTGLGLYISKMVLEMHLNAKLSVKSKGKSTTFYIIINKQN